MSSTQRHRPAARQRGGAYVAVLATTMLVLVIGIGGLTANRLAAQSSALTSDAVQARLLATSAIDLALLHIADNPATWRADFAAQSVLQQQGFGRGVLTVTATDPADGDLTNDTSQQVLLHAEAEFDDARMLLEVTLSGEGVPVTGSWRSPTD